MIFVNKYENEKWILTVATNTSEEVDIDLLFFQEIREQKGVKNRPMSSELTRGSTSTHR